MQKYTKPSFGKRVAAYTVDYFISLVLASPLVIMFILLDAFIAKPQGNDSLSGLLLVLMMLSLFSITIGYFLLRDGISKGSYGKRWLGLMVIDEKTNQPCGFGKSIFRNFIFIVIGGIDGFIPLFTSDGRKASDMVAGTLVINKEELNNNQDGISKN